MSSVALVASYLDGASRTKLAKSLSSTLDSDESVLLLCELVPALDAATIDEIFASLWQFCVASIRREDIDAVRALAAAMPRLGSELWQHAHGGLRRFLQSSQLNFLPIARLHQAQPGDEDFASVTALLDFAECMSMQLATAPALFDRTVLLLLGSNDESISTKASSIVRWRMAHMQEPAAFVWQIVFVLEESPMRHHKSQAYTLWLRQLTSTGVDAATVATDHYWQCIQRGLTSASHEHRKLCLSVLQLSVKALSHSFCNSVMQWHSDAQEQYLAEWARYVTLYEILAIDTSLHQAQAGTSELLGLISPHSKIHASWGFCLLATGFSASMDSVRKFALGLLLSIEPDNLYLLKDGAAFLQQVFLPKAMLATHFHTRRLGCTNENVCPYGGQLRDFVLGVVGSLCSKGLHEDLKVVTQAVLVALNTADCFDPARIYVALGLLQGLTAPVLSLATDELVQLFEHRPEGDLYERAMKTVYLQLVTRFEFALGPFCRVVDRFIHLNGAAVVRDNLALLVDHLRRNGVTATQLQSVYCGTASVRALVYGLALAMGVITREWALDDLVAALVLKQGLAKPLGDRLERWLKGQVSFDSIAEEQTFYAAWADAESTPESNAALDQFRQTTYAQVHSSDPLVLHNVAKKLKVLSSVATDTASLLKLPTLLPRGMPRKVREETLAQVYKMLRASAVGISDEEIVTIAELVECHSLHPEMNMALAQLLAALIAEADRPDTIVSVVATLYSLWTNLTEARLILNQKNLHCLIIGTMYNPKVLALTQLGPTLLAFGIQVVDNSHSRRCLLPTLTLHLSQYQAAGQLESLGWVPEILVKCFTMQQLNSNAFKLEKIVGKLYDEQIGGSDLYAAVYGPDEISTRVNVMAILGSSGDADFSQQVIEYIFDHDADFCLSRVTRRTDGFEEWRRVQLMSLILLAGRNVPLYMETLILPRLFVMLETDPSPLVRVYVEWMVAQYAQTPLLYKQLKELVELNGAKPTLLVLYERILYLKIMQLPPEEQQVAITEFLTLLVPASASNKVTIRHFSLSLICSIAPNIAQKRLTLERSLLKVVTNMYQAAILSELYGQHRSGDAVVWDIRQDMSLVSISGGVLLRVSDRDIDFITSETYQRLLTADQCQRLAVPIGDNFEELWIKERKYDLKRALVTSAGSAKADTLQTKSGAFNAVGVDNATHVDRSDLIVMASLVDKPPNLGGICRLSDVLGAGLLTLHDLNVKNHAQFKSVAVTADLWMPMIEVRPDNIISYLHDRKRAGYTLIGLEQTDKSVVLSSSLQFPKKSLIVLGREKEGIPGDLLAELDFCVEIKQVGVIRSMNIQTATAVIVHAYSAQHC